VNEIICPNCGSENRLENTKCEECKAILKLNDKYYLKKVIGENTQITYLGDFLPSEPNTPHLQSRHPAQAGIDVVTVVIKELSVSSLEDWKNEDLFKREVAVLKSLNHEQIPKLIDDFELSDGRGDVYYLVMEYIEGISLAGEISEKRYSEEESLELIEELLDVLDYLHSFSPPIVHRDIKPSNIIRRKSDNKLVLIDFGAVTDVLKPEGGSTVVGTYGYMAPEQFMGKASVQSDYYSLGAIIIKLLTKQALHEIIDISDLGFIDKINVSDKMKVILKKLLTLDLNQRVKSTKEILELIQKYKDNTLDTTANVGVSLCAHPTTLPKEIKEVKRKREENLIENNKDLENIKKDYEKLEQLFNKKIILEEESNNLHGLAAIFLGSIFWAVSLIYFVDAKILNAPIFFSLLALSIMFSTFIYKKTKGNSKGLNEELKLLRKKLKALRLDDEFIYLFLDQRLEDFLLNEEINKELKIHLKDDLKKDLNEGKLIIYKNLFKKIEESKYGWRYFKK
jgi:serine/threonine protein kinase